MSARLELPDAADEAPDEASVLADLAVGRLDVAQAAALSGGDPR